MTKTAIVLGAGSAGLIAAKELKGAGFDVRIFDKNQSIGGIWASTAWKTYTLTSSKWVTEYGCFPMPEDFPDFLTNEHMLQYLDAFTDKYALKPLIEFDQHIEAIEKCANGQLSVKTNQGCYANIDYVAVSCGLHGTPYMPQYEGLEQFQGEVSHSSIYQTAAPYKDKKLLCVGLGESGVGLISELSTMTERLVVSSEGVAIAPRVIKGSQNPFDQMQFWQVGRFMIGYQEVLTSGLSWYFRRIPYFLKKFNVTRCLKFYSDYSVKFEDFEQWFPKALIPNHFHVKFWAKPNSTDSSGNLTRCNAPSDDIFYLIKTGKIIPKGRVKSFDSNGVFFEDGSYETVDSIMLNTGYKPGSHSIKFPDNWTYNHADLYKGCIHPQIPNLAFIGMVRPTIGSIPAMAEMHARIVAAYFSGTATLPDEKTRMEIITEDNLQHKKQFPEMHERFPHIYFFDDWMEKMSDTIGARPKLSAHLSSFDRIKAYFFGAPMPLRYRMQGPDQLENAEKIYIKRVNKIWGNSFGQWARSTVLIHLVAPYILSLLIFVLSLSTFQLPAVFSAASSIAFFLLYWRIDLFRFVIDLILVQPVTILTGLFFLKGYRKEKPDYEQPKIFQTVE